MFLPVSAGRAGRAFLPRPSIDMLREPDHLASAGNWRGARMRPTAAKMARLLSGLSNFALVSIFKTSGTISTKVRVTGAAFSLVESRDGLQSDRFPHTRLPRHRKSLEEIYQDRLCPHRVAKRTAFRRLHNHRTALGPVPGIAVIRNRFYDLAAFMATLFRRL